MKPQVDDAGYDLVLEANSTIRHIQLKSSFHGASTSTQKIHVRLADKPGGCVVWIRFNPETLELGPFLWFGNPAGHPLPSLEAFKVAKHTKGNAKGVKAERPMLRVVPKGQFKKLDSVDELVLNLFGLEL